uniref:Uncharacterized protein LOC110201734 isoform X2 n=1 Tax=Phascolarctos cinereus TaxID=38626 RepID=A0A6P5JG90_PHACI|nr:uncharacterized protein LOC110201734 isoform X2 [Phascolarctos cinereus]XP_020833254.1 uncharacterized protein LOC110201734 isoform X2 [Phascolarctos cinereus]
MIPPVNSGDCRSRASPPWGERQVRPSGVRSVKSQSCFPVSRGHNWTPAGAWCPQLGARNLGPRKERNNSSLELSQTGSPEEEGAGVGGGEGAGERAEKNLANGSGCCWKPPAQSPAPRHSSRGPILAKGSRQAQPFSSSFLFFFCLGWGSPSRWCCCWCWPPQGLCPEVEICVNPRYICLLLHLLASTSVSAFLLPVAPCGINAYSNDDVNQYSWPWIKPSLEVCFTFLSLTEEGDGDSSPSVFIS